MEQRFTKEQLEQIQKFQQIQGMQNMQNMQNVKQRQPQQMSQQQQNKQNEASLKGFALLKSMYDIYFLSAKDPQNIDWDYINKGFAGVPVPIVKFKTPEVGFYICSPNGEYSFNVQSLVSVESYFECEEYDGVLMPPNLSRMEKVLRAAKRKMQKYDDRIKAQIIMRSLMEHKFNDTFIFKD